jgi:hypothetical protein
MAYVGFGKLKAMIAKKGGAKDAGAIAASVARKKYGDKAVQEHAAKGTSMKNTKPKKHYG